MTPIRAAEHETTFEDKISAGFRAFLETLAATPASAKMCIVEVLAAGPEAIGRRDEVMEEFSHRIEDNAPLMAAATRSPPLTAETIVGGVYETIYRRIARGRDAELPTLLPDLTESALLPYVGPRAAASHARRLRALDPHPVPTATPGAAV